MGEVRAEISMQRRALVTVDIDKFRAAYPDEWDEARSEADNIRDFLNDEGPLLFDDASPSDDGVHIELDAAFDDECEVQILVVTR